MARKRGRARTTYERNVKQANRRLQSMRAKGLGKLSVIDLALSEFEKATGKSGKNFSKDVVNIEKANKQVQKFLNSKWTTDKGRQEILQKRVKAFTNKKGEYRLTEKKALQLFDIFSTDAYHKAVEKGLLDSSQMIDIMRGRRRQDLTTAMENALDSLVKQEKIDPEESRIFIERMLSET